MIVSHQYKFIFIKTHKTAGSSMEVALGRLCGPDDIITPMESNADSGVPRNFHSKSLLGRIYARSRLLRKCIDRHSGMIAPWFYEHMPATRVRQLVPENVWNTYHKFCFERNPWEKVVSYYNWKKFGQDRRMPDFKTWVMTRTHRLPLDASLYFDGETCLMDEVLDYSDFMVSFTAVCAKLKIPFDGVMPREKTDIVPTKVDHHRYYDQETQLKVETEFRREIRIMGYTFSPESA